jgi:Putative addiction module component
MNLQYITDANGQTTGVFIPIDEWNDLKTRFKDIDEQSLEIPEWHKEIVRRRMELINNNPKELLDFHNAIDTIEKDL